MRDAPRSAPKSSGIDGLGSAHRVEEAHSRLVGGLLRETVEQVRDCSCEAIRKRGIEISGLHHRTSPPSSESTATTP